MRQKRIGPEQRAELAASKSAAAIEGLKPFTGIVATFGPARLIRWPQRLSQIEPPAMTSSLRSADAQYRIRFPPVLEERQRQLRTSTVIFPLKKSENPVSTG
jgi:hypothetical protein